MENLEMIMNLHSYYKGKKILVTGHTGFKGAWLIAWLSKMGATIKGYALAPEQSNSLFNILEPSLQITSIIADIRNKQKLSEELLEFQPDFVFHLAAQPLVRKSYTIPAETFEVNVTGTANLLEAIIKLEKKCTVVIVTTDKVYENKEQNILYAESDTLGGYDPYSASKACTELVVSSFRNSFFNELKINQHHKAIATARAGNVIGGGDFSKDRIIPDIINSLKNHTAVQVRNPMAVRPWQHVLEPLGGYLLLGALLDTDGVKYSGAYNFGPLPSDHLRVKDLADLVIKTWGSGQWDDMSDPSQPHEATLLKLDIKKAMDVLGWRPKLSANKAIEWTTDWYRNDDNPAGYTIKQLEHYLTL